jgi:hypothetical protein
MTGKELLNYLSNLSKKDLSKDIFLSEGDRFYDMDCPFKSDDFIAFEISQILD